MILLKACGVGYYLDQRGMPTIEPTHIARTVEEDARREELIAAVVERHSYKLGKVPTRDHLAIEQRIRNAVERLDVS